jgi:hypothetical protein
MLTALADDQGRRKALLRRSSCPHGMGICATVQSLARYAQLA